MQEIKDKHMLEHYLSTFHLHELISDRVRATVNLFEFQKGENLCASGDAVEHLYFLVEGKVKVFATLPNGKSLLVRFINPLGLIGDMELFTASEVKNTVQSINRSVAIALKLSVLSDFCLHDPLFLRFVLKQVSHKLYTLSNSTNLNLLYPLENRFATYLLSIMQEGEEFTFVDEIKTSNLTELADLLGTSYRHLNRVINQLSMQGIVKRENRGIMVLHIDKLRELANGTIYQ